MHKGASDVRSREEIARQAEPPVPRKSIELSSVLFALLGASNLTLALPFAIQHILERLSRTPVDIFVAHGFGRSYGIEAGMFGFRRPGLARSGILDAVEKAKEIAPSADVLALLMDIGNDIMYGVSVAALSDWLGEIVTRFQRIGATVAAASLPVEAITTMASWRYRAVRTLIYPGRSIPQHEVLERIVAVQERLEKLHTTSKLLLLPTATEYSGPDRLHLVPSASRVLLPAWIDAVLQSHLGYLPAKSKQQRVSRTSLFLHSPAASLLPGRSRETEQRGLPLTPEVRLFSY